MEGASSSRLSWSTHISSYVDLDTDAQQPAISTNHGKSILGNKLSNTCSEVWSSVEYASVFSLLASRLDANVDLALPVARILLESTVWTKHTGMI